MSNKGHGGKKAASAKGDGGGKKATAIEEPRASLAPPLVVDRTAEMRQLTSLRARFAPLPDALAAALLAQHSEAVCREAGGNTVAEQTFRGAMSWARVLTAHADDAAVQAMGQRVRWFLDCLVDLGAGLSGQYVAQNPAATATFSDARQRVRKQLERLERKARDAVGDQAVFVAKIEEAMKIDTTDDPTVTQARRLGALLGEWVQTGVPKAPAVGVYGVTMSSVDELRKAMEAFQHAIEHRPAAKQASRDTPAVNVAEGRLFKVMKSIWDDLAEAREDGVTSLVLPVTPTLLRGMRIRSERRERKGGE